MTRFRWLTSRVTGWTVLVCTCGAALLLLVGWVEWASRWTGSGSALAVALLEIPERWVQLSPLMVALAGAIFGVRLVAAGEWEGLGAMGIGVRARLWPVCVVALSLGLFGALASERWVPDAERARQLRVASAEARPVSDADTLWLRVDDVVFGVSHVDSSFQGRALRWSDGAVEGIWAAALHWTSNGWVAEEEPDQGEIGAGPWSLLPSPDRIEEMERIERWSGRTWAELGAEASAGASAERGMRLARIAACVLAACVGVLLSVGGALGTAAVFWAVVPVALVELVSLALQSVAAQGSLFPSAPALFRVAFLLLILGLAARRVGRPH